jgi:hypothetical protein
MYSVPCTVYCVQCTMYTAKCTMYSVVCTVYRTPAGPRPPYSSAHIRAGAALLGPTLRGPPSPHSQIQASHRELYRHYNCRHCTVFLKMCRFSKQDMAKVTFDMKSTAFHLSIFWKPCPIQVKENCSRQERANCLK